MFSVAKLLKVSKLLTFPQTSSKTLMVSGKFIVKLIISIPSPKYAGVSQIPIYGGARAISNLAKVLHIIL